MGEGKGGNRWLPRNGCLKQSSFLLLYPVPLPQGHMVNPFQQGELVCSEDEVGGACFRGQETKPFWDCLMPSISRRGQCGLEGGESMEATEQGTQN